jgi:hypothetical protein
VEEVPPFLALAVEDVPPFLTLAMEETPSNSEWISVLKLEYSTLILKYADVNLECRNMNSVNSAVKSG